MKPLTEKHKEELIKRVEHLILCIETINTSKSDDVICSMGAGVTLLDRTIEKIQNEIK